MLSTTRCGTESNEPAHSRENSVEQHESNENQSGYPLRTADELETRIRSALSRATEREGHLLLIFGANWCSDCRRVEELLSQPPASDVLNERYETVKVNIDSGADRLSAHYGVSRIATLVVLDAESRRVAQSTLEPISNRTGLSSAALADWLRAPADFTGPQGGPNPLGASAVPLDDTVGPLFDPNSGQ